MEVEPSIQLALSTAMMRQRSQKPNPPTQKPILGAQNSGPARRAR